MPISDQLSVNWLERPDLCSISVFKQLLPNACRTIQQTLISYRIYISTLFVRRLENVAVHFAFHLYHIAFMAVIESVRVCPEGWLFGPY